MKKILVVDDEEDLCEILQFNLKNSGYNVDVAYSSEEAFAKLKNNYDLLLLDVMMGGISGFKLAELIRQEYHNDVPIMFITARDNESDKLKGFNLGADDYISKPFSIKEVIARVNAVLIRTDNSLKKKAIEEIEKVEQKSEINTKNSKKENITVNDLTINMENKSVSLSGVLIKLTKKEFEILQMLINEPYKVFSRTNILDAVWKNEAYVLERTVDVHIARLRKKLLQYGSCIVNRSGYGYCFDINEAGKD
jgi:two-component system alkaline phosphatase synthesis response regulator PhoP